MNARTSVVAVETSYEDITIIALDHVVPAEFVEQMKV